LYVASTTGRVGIGTSTPAYKLQIAGDIAPTSDNLYSLGTSTLRWSNIFAASSTVGDLIFGNDFRFVEDYETPQALILKNQKGEEIMRLDENGNMILAGGITSSSTQANSSQSGEIADSFIDVLVAKVKEILASLGMAIENGIAKAKEFIADRVTTKELCVEDVCINKAQLKELLEKNQITTDVVPPTPEVPTDTVAPADAVPPVITLVGNSIININVGDPYVDEGATAADDIDGDLTASITKGGTFVDASTAGTYTVTYNVSDAAGNAAIEAIRTVNVNALEVELP